MNSTPSIVVATRNPGKIREIHAVLADLPVTLRSLEPFGDLPEPEETGETFADNAALKALYYAQATGHWALADDSGLQVDALGGDPGVRSARYAADRVPPTAGREQIDQANNAKLLNQLRDVPDAQRTGRFVCFIALADPRGVLVEASGTVEGCILHAPRGENGFGYDPLFYIPDLGHTTAELPAERKNAISHRGQALRAFAERLREMLAARA